MCPRIRRPQSSRSLCTCARGCRALSSASGACEPAAPPLPTSRARAALSAVPWPCVVPRPRARRRGSRRGRRSAAARRGGHAGGRAVPIQRGRRRYTYSDCYASRDLGPRSPKIGQNMSSFFAWRTRPATPPKCLFRRFASFPPTWSAEIARNGSKTAATRATRANLGPGTAPAGPHRPLAAAPGPTCPNYYAPLFTPFVWVVQSGA